MKLEVMAKQYAISQGYKDAKYFADWKLYKVFKIDYGGPVNIGAPFVILWKDGVFRISTIEESYKILEYMIENSPEEE
jgi:hypothetical protein